MDAINDFLKKEVDEVPEHIRFGIWVLTCLILGFLFTGITVIFKAPWWLATIPYTFLDFYVYYSLHLHRDTKDNNESDISK